MERLLENGSRFVNESSDFLRGTSGRHVAEAVWGAAECLEAERKAVFREQKREDGDILGLERAEKKMWNRESEQAVSHSWKEKKTRVGEEGA